MTRKLVAQEYIRDLETWKHKHGYGQHRITEKALPSLKRSLGEYVAARKFRNMTKEMMLKASPYNLFIGLTVNP